MRSALTLGPLYPFEKPCFPSPLSDFFNAPSLTAAMYFLILSALCQRTASFLRSLDFLFLRLNLFEFRSDFVNALLSGLLFFLLSVTPRIAPRAQSSSSRQCMPANIPQASHARCPARPFAVFPVSNSRVPATNMPVGSRANAIVGVGA